MMELQRADAERQIERHGGAQDVPAEPAEAALVIALVETCALVEHFSYRVERQQHRDQRGGCDDRDDSNHDDARALRARAAGHDHQRQHEGRRQEESAPCRA